MISIPMDLQDALITTYEPRGVQGIALISEIKREQRAVVILTPEA
jgi:hypothetical protein